MYTVYYYRADDSEDLSLHPVKGCGTFIDEFKTIDLAKEFAMYPERGLGYVPATPVVFVVVKLIGRAEHAKVTWIPYESKPEPISCLACGR